MTAAMLLYPLVAMGADQTALHRVHHQVHVFKGDNAYKGFVAIGEHKGMAAGVAVLPVDVYQLRNNTFLRHLAREKYRCIPFYSSKY
jgi:hypothetical protein